MKVSVLVENEISKSCNSSFGCEHGLSVHIQLQNLSVLFDTGQTEIFAKNALEMGIDISEVNILVISHGHYDHGGGLQKFFELNTKAKVYMHRKSIGDYYSTSIGEPRYIGLNKSVIESNRHRITFIDDNFKIAENINILTNFPKDFPLPTGNSKLLEKQSDKFHIDKFEHEILLLISENNKNLVFTACSHSGIINMVNRAKQYLNGRGITSVLGGFHLSSRGKNAESLEYIDNLTSEIKKCNIPFYTGHCTGTANFISMKKILGDNLLSMNVGEVIEF